MNELVMKEDDRPSAIAERSPMGGHKGIAARTLPEAVEFAKLMCQSKQGVPKPFRGEPGLCLAVTMQALRWGFDPFGVAQNAYVVNDKVAYEAKVIKAAIDANAGLAEPMDFQYEGEGQERFCRAVGKLLSARGEIIERFYETPRLKDITPKNSPLWKTDPDQQLAYFAARSWARRFTPGVMLGVYSDDEAKEWGPVINAEPTPTLADQLKASKKPVQDESEPEPRDMGEVQYATDEALESPPEVIEEPPALEVEIEEPKGVFPGDAGKSPEEVAAALWRDLQRAKTLSTFKKTFSAAFNDGRVEIIEQDQKVKDRFFKHLNERKAELTEKEESNDD